MHAYLFQCIFSFSAQLDLEILGRLPEDSSQSFLRGPHGEPVLVAEQQLTATKVSLKVSIYF